MSPVEEAQVAVTPDRLPWTRYAPIGLTGVFIVPILLMVIFNSYGPPGPAEYVQMAFATVAGCVIAILTMTGLTVASFMLKSKSRISLTVVSAVLITASLSNIASAGELLLQRLG